MERLIFPVTRREAEKGGRPYSSAENRNALFPSQLRELRKEKGISQEALARDLGVSKSTIGLYETGDTLPDAKTLHDLAVYFDVSADWLLGLTDVRTPDSTVREIYRYTGLDENAVKTLGGWADLADRVKEMDGPVCTTVLDVLNTLLGAHIPDEYVERDDPVALFHALLEALATLRDIYRIAYSQLPEEERAALLERNRLEDYSDRPHVWSGVEGFRATQAFHSLLAQFLKPPELGK